LVGTNSARQNVISVSTNQPIITTPAIDGIVSACAPNRIALRIPSQPVIVVGPIEVFNGVVGISSGDTGIVG